MTSETISGSEMAGTMKDQDVVFCLVIGLIILLPHVFYNRSESTNNISNGWGEVYGK
jgi:hypothetical protein